MSTPLHPLRHVTVTATLASALLLAGCAGDADPDASATATPSVAASTTAAPTTAAGADDSPAPTAATVEDLVGLWSIGGAVVSVESAPNDDGETDPEAYFASQFSDGTGSVEISHEVSTTAGGAPVLFVDIEPEGGSAQTMFSVLTADEILTGTLAYDGDVDADQRALLVGFATSPTS